MKKLGNKRNLNCDILRIIAFVFVVSVHALGNIGFYLTLNQGPTMLALNFIRPLIMSCVPIFMVLSGYLTKDAEFNKSYILKLGKIILTYVLCSIACLICLHFLEHRELLSLKSYIGSILSFNAAPYAWYVNMYIGLYLLIPFLNKLWKSLPSKKYKQNLLLVLSFLFVLPTLLNIFNFSDISWWLHPTYEYSQIIPNYWYGNWYPILYYFLGRYLKEYKLPIKFKTNIFLIIISLLTFGLFNYYRNYKQYFNWSIFVDYSSFEVFIITILLVNLILNYKQINLKNIKLTKFINKVAILTFGAYLLSRIFDVWFAPYIMKTSLYVKGRLLYFIPSIIVISCLSLLFSYGIDCLAKLIIKIYELMKRRLNGITRNS